MRGADGGPWARICALPAFWVGLLYDGDSLSAAWDVAKNWSTEEREALRRNAAKDGLRAEIGGRTVQDIAMDVLKISNEGLRRRAMPGKLDPDETGYLEPLKKIAESGISMGEFTADHFLADLSGDAKRLFEECKY